MLIAEHRGSVKRLVLINFGVGTGVQTGAGVAGGVPGAVSVGDAADSQ